MNTSYPVNYIHHLRTFYEHVREMDCLQANDISLYMALFQIWNANQFNNPFPVRRDEMLQLSKIGSANTYSKCLKNLDLLHFIAYRPSSKRYAPSLISIYPLERRSRPLCIKNDTHGKIKNDTHTDIKVDTHNRLKSNTRRISILRRLNKQIKLNRKESQTGHPHTKKMNDTFKVPSIEEVKAYFLAAAQPEKEGRKFYFHNKATGWELSGKPIFDWKAAADKWIENIFSPRKTSTNAKPGELHTKQDKSYADPL